MEYVEPIKDIELINAIKKVLRQQSNRDFLLFVLGINTGLRISDLLSLRVRDVWDGDKCREFLYIPDSKSGEAYYLNAKVQRALENYLSQSPLTDEDYLFKSKKNNYSITRQQAYRIINNAAREAGIAGKIGTHTLRKTFGYHAYRKGVAIGFLMKIFHHHSPAETLKYIGIDENDKELVRVDVNL